ncbi:MAG: S24/S26 family peptidase [Clostridia bacterium]|nr:S24/S26 family peptidase [Clostridia bacterium]
MTNLERILKENKVVVAKTEGDSMYPMLVEGRDNVMIAPPIFPLKKYDVPVYRRDGHYTMHRIVKVTKRGYIICGDNRAYLERDIKNCDIVGVLIAFYHDGKFVNCTDEDYMKYAKKVCRNLPVRIVKRLIKRIFKKA